MFSATHDLVDELLMIFASVNEDSPIHEVLAYLDEGISECSKHEINPAHLGKMLKRLKKMVRIESYSRSAIISGFSTHCFNRARTASAAPVAPGIGTAQKNLIGTRVRSSLDFDALHHLKSLLLVRMSELANPEVSELFEAMSANSNQAKAQLEKFTAWRKTINEHLADQLEYDRLVVEVSDLEDLLGRDEQAELKKFQDDCDEAEKELAEKEGQLKKLHNVAAIVSCVSMSEFYLSALTHRSSTASRIPFSNLPSGCGRRWARKRRRSKQWCVKVSIWSP